MRICLITFLLLVSFTTAFAQARRWAAGLKIGEPTGLNLRKYGDRNALDMTVGTYGGVVGVYRSYRRGEYRRPGVMFNGTYVWYVPFFSGRMSAYAGPGFQVNLRRYYVTLAGQANSYAKSVSLGPSGTAGLEYFSRQKSSSFFVEGGGYAEVVPDFLFTSPQVSIGVRTNF